MTYNLLIIKLSSILKNSDLLNKIHSNTEATEPYSWFVLFMLTGVSVFAFIDRQLVIVLQEPIKQELGLTDGQLGFISGMAYAMLYVIMVIPIAWMADRYSRRNIIVISLAIWSFITSLTGLANNFMQITLARMGVGMGEAGSGPASHSMIADYFPQGKRSIAYAIHGMGVYIGLLFGFALGGLLEKFYGWRAAFYILGTPGLLFSILFYFTVKEPLREKSPIETIQEKQPEIKEVFFFLLSKKTLVYLGLAAVLHTFVGSSFASWMPSFLSRVHNMSILEIGLWLAFAIGVCGAGGTFLGGVLGDRLSKKNVKWYVWLPAVSILISIPFAYGLLFSSSKIIALLSYLIPNITYAIFLGPSYALLQGMVSSRMRALASAMMMMMMSLLGMGLGPYITGVLSDLFEPSLGINSLRWSLFCVGNLDLLAAYFFYKASFVLEDDLISSPRSQA